MLSPRLLNHRTPSPKLPSHRTPSPRLPSSRQMAPEPLSKHVSSSNLLPAHQLLTLRFSCPEATGTSSFPVPRPPPSCPQEPPRDREPGWYVLINYTHKSTAMLIHPLQIFPLPPSPLSLRRLALTIARALRLPRTDTLQCAPDGPGEDWSPQQSLRMDHVGHM